VHLQKRFLKGIFSHRPISDQTHQKTQQIVVMAADQLLERRSVSTSVCTNQLFVSTLFGHGGSLGRCVVHGTGSSRRKPTGEGDGEGSRHTQCTGESAGGFGSEKHKVRTAFGYA
jgi:hypothetical protein